MHDFIGPHDSVMLLLVDVIKIVFYLFYCEIVDNQYFSNSDLRGITSPLFDSTVKFAYICPGLHSKVLLCYSIP